MTIEPGQPIPSVPIKHVTGAGVADASSADVLGSGTVVFFTVPGAFTPTCHLNHLPGYVAAADELKAAGVDRIVCGTVNDHHVVKAWAEASDPDHKLEFIADGLGRLAKELDLVRDLTSGGLGLRFSRTSLLIRDGVVEQVNVEGVPGEVTNSGAPAMLASLKS
ncbi:peroxiredoxin [Pelagibacterium lacus]|uniref:Glutathione-dependent peroxiredoxin n=1 Tax=Pelagibacterium lacus TaxID=2282655 RepID=A0A369W7P3_9HYPH|nr:redoxin family protein [Pelagibacterium lacus]RDE10618.1 peroxiredoxin [Pelagibacterium lacus]